MDNLSKGHDSRKIASYVVSTGRQKGCHYTPLQVIKLTYLCHGWMLGLYGSPISLHPVEAWKYGPVIPAIYEQVRVYGRNHVKELEGYSVSGHDLDEFQTNLIGQVLEVYKEYSGVELSALTHRKGTPWHEIYHSKGVNHIIPDELIRSHFAELAKQ